MKIYLFVLCPPFSGSTILWKLISTSEKVSALPSEGQFLNETKKIMREDPWNKDYDMPWADIKQVWDQYWDHEKDVLLEKSPPNLIRAEQISACFRPAKFVVMVRNPYAHCEGLMRRNHWSARKAAEFSAQCLRAQMNNMNNLDGPLSVTYEELVGDPEGVTHRIERSIPELGRLDCKAEFEVHSIDRAGKRNIIDLNHKKMNNLSAGSINLISDILRANDDVMKFWGYDYMSPMPGHNYQFMKTRLNILATSLAAKTKKLASRRK